VLGSQNRSTYGLASTHFFLRLNLIKGTFNIAFYTHTHTSIQHEISSEILTYISHASYIIINPSTTIMVIISSHLRQQASKVS